MSAEIMATIVSGSRAESDAAFSRLVECWQGPITGYAFRLLRSWSDAEDVFQGVMLTVFQHAGNYRDQSFSGWIYSITERRCIDTIRKRKSDPLANRINPTDEFDPLSLAPVEAPSTLDEMIDGEDVRNIMAALDSVPDAQRATFELYAEGYSLPDIAEAGGVCTSTAKSHLRLAREKIRERVQ